MLEWLGPLGAFAVVMIPLSLIYLVIIIVLGDVEENE